MRGVVNGISVFERGDKGKEGLVICAGTGKEMKTGKWMKVQGRNGGMVLEIERKVLEETSASNEEEEEAE